MLYCIVLYILLHTTKYNIMSIFILFYYLSINILASMLLIEYNYTHTIKGILTKGFTMPYYSMNFKDKEQITFTTDDYQLIVDIHMGNDFIIYELQAAGVSSYETIHVGKLPIAQWRAIRSNQQGDTDAYIVEIFLGISKNSFTKEYIRGSESISFNNSIVTYSVQSVPVSTFTIPSNNCFKTMCFVYTTFLAIAASLERMGMNLKYPVFCYTCGLPASPLYIGGLGIKRCQKCHLKLCKEAYLDGEFDE